MLHRMFYFGVGAIVGYCCKTKKEKKKDNKDLD